jgi:periplasmic protein TonB
MYLLYRSRHFFSGLPLLLVIGGLWFVNQQNELKIQPYYDETAIELTMVEQAPEPQQESQPAPQPDPEPPLLEPVSEPEPVVSTPEPVIETVPIVKPQPKPKPVKEVAKPVEKARPIATSVKTLTSNRAVPISPTTAPTHPSATSSVQAIENGYLQELRRELEQRKRYPSGRQASLEHPQGNVEVWLEVDRSGRVMASGISSKATSMLLNRAAMSSLQSLSQVKPFPNDAFSGQTTKRFSATFNYQTP